MPKEVWKEAYEIVGDGIAYAEAFYAEQEAAEQARWDFVHSMGAEGFRPNYNGRARSLFFKEMPQHYRQIGREGALIECVPHKGSRAGKELAKKLDASPKVPNDRCLPDKFGWEGRSPIDGYRIYHATATKLTLPTVRYLVRLPRQLDDGYSAPPTLRLIPMSEFIKAFEDHNEIARRQSAEASEVA